jgi:hypothetical protein
MNYHWEDATKRIQKELGDPSLRVEFNSENQLYEVLQWKPRIQYEKIPGFVFGSEADLVSIGIPTGYWMVAMTFDAWDNRVFEEMRKGRPDRLSDKELFARMREQKERVKKSRENTVKDWDREVIMSMHRASHPVVYSYQKEVS